ncbi:MAG TPA: L,D-transpeptidase [Tissierellaceae bacterium]|nr:L,D-transpeptidase [Tissierellaceae bacterium]
MNKLSSIIVWIIAPILVGLYFIGVFYYKDKFPSNVYVNEVNIGGLTLLKADDKLANSNLWEEIIIRSDTEKFLVIEAEEIDYKYISTPNLPEIFNKENERNWLLAIFNDSVYTTHILSDYNKDKIKNLVDSIKELDKRVLNAKIVYSSDLGFFVIEPHSYEIKLTKQQVLDLVVEGIEKLDREVNIEKYIEQPAILDHDKSLIAAKNKANEYLKIKIKYDFGDREEIVDGPILKDFIAFDGTEVNIDSEKVKEFVTKLAIKYDTFASRRNFKTSRGEIISTSGGSYGWLTHRGKTSDALIEHIQNGESVVIEPVYSYEALIRNSDDIGDSYVEIDLDQQMVYVYIEGELKIKTETVTGNASKGQNTPPGVYPINYKETDAILVGEDYASPVKYWMPFNKNIGLHDADWRDSFGGDIYQSDGSNGCINLPPNTAKTIFDLVYPGMPVIVH